ncbi:MAG: NeuD/PglB/VioB family sugar acetyltransferase [Pedobacter sp.]|nr:NeuD/PglB/VioB family sugar acetyltransferase [Pedobacter sp.]
MKDLILIGGGGHCKSCIDVIECEGKFSIKGIIDKKERFGEEVLGYPIIGSDDDIELLSKKVKNFLITIGQIKNVKPRIDAYLSLRSLDISLPVIISPLAYVSKHAHIGEGSIIMHFSQVNASSRIGINCILNSKCLVEHDAIIGDHCHISTGAIINGGVQLGSRSFFGSGAISRQSSYIPDDSFIKANSIVQ